MFPGGRYAAHPDGGWPGVVTSVARKYATAEYDDGQIVEFSMETGFGRDAHPYYGMRVMTPAEIALDERRKQAERAIRDSRQVELRPGHNLSLEQIAAIVGDVA